MNNRAKMLSKISFDEFYEEEKLDSIGDKKSTILALLSQKKKLSSTQIHKLLFLAFAEGKILLPFTFIKHHYGPYSLEIKSTVDELERVGAIRTTKEKVISLDKNVIFLSDNWQNLEGINQENVTKIIRLLKSLIESHDEGARSLENYCYKAYFLNPKNQNPAEWRAMVKNKISDLRDLLHERKKKVEDFEEIEEEKRVMILSSFDYIDSLLEKIFSRDDLDQVIQGVLIKNSEDYINCWGEVLRLIKEGSLDEIKKLLFEIRRTFRFINEVAAQYSIFESVFELQN